MVLIFWLCVVVGVLATFIGHRSCVRELKRMDHDSNIANIRVEPSESDFRKFFEAPTEQFQRLVHDAENPRRRIVRRRLFGFRCLAVVWCVVVVLALSGCSSTRTITNYYTAKIDSTLYEFRVTQTEQMSTEKK